MLMLMLRREERGTNPSLSQSQRTGQICSIYGRYLTDQREGGAKVELSIS